MEARPALVQSDELISLIKRVSAGDADAEQAFVDCIQGFLTTIVATMVPPEGVGGMDRADVCQEVLQRILVAAREGKLRAGVEALGYFRGAVLNEVRNASRAGQRYVRHTSAYAHEDAPEIQVPPWMDTEARLLQRRVQTELSKLSEEDQEIFRLAVAEGLPPATVASRMGMTKQNVYVRLHRARARLRTALDDILD